MIYEDVLMKTFGLPDLSEAKRSQLVETLRNSDMNSIPQSIELQKSDYVVSCKQNHDSSSSLSSPVGRIYSLVISPNESSLQLIILYHFYTKGHKNL